jgi:hypothetical protein
MMPNPEYLSTLDQPVQCTHCGGLYDLGAVNTEGDWQTPCCGTKANRSSQPAYQQLEKP